MPMKQRRLVLDEAMQDATIPFADIPAQDAKVWAAKDVVIAGENIRLVIWKSKLHV